MYATCLRCERPLGANAELPHLPVGRRVAFDAGTGRLWVVCTRCGQWNLTPIEERWEALAECERLARAAEARVSGGALGLARTASGLELLRVGGLADEDVANWRYGRRLAVRQRVAEWVLLALSVVVIALGVGAARLAEAPLLAVYVMVLLGGWLVPVWRHPPRPWTRLTDGAGGTYLLWPWQVAEVELVAADGGGPWLFVPHARGQAWLRGVRAAQVLAGLLARLNQTEYYVDVRSAVQRVAGAEAAAEAAAAPRPSALGESVTSVAGRWARERGLAPPAGSSDSRPSRRSPWERLVGRQPRVAVHRLPAEERLALEMATTEEVERAVLRDRAAALTPAWREEEAIGAIADGLLVPEGVAERLAVVRAGRDARRGPDASR